MIAAAIEWESLGQGEHRIACPACSRSERDKTLGVSINAGRGVAHCFRCEYVETMRGEVRPSPALVRPAAPIKRETLSDYGRELWSGCIAISGAARDYLQSRGCVIPPADGHLRWHHGLRHPVTGYTGPALVALLTDAADARVARTLHRTWVRADGSKAPEADPPRLLLGGHRKAGAVCRLWLDEAVTYGLGVAEGIETALSLAHGLSPVWACVDAGNLACFPVLDGVECLTIAADHDDAGLRAAQDCAQRWSDAGCDVAVVIPPTPGADLNNVAAA